MSTTDTTNLQINSLTQKSYKEIGTNAYVTRSEHYQIEGDIDVVHFALLYVHTYTEIKSLKANVTTLLAVENWHLVLTLTISKASYGFYRVSTREHSAIKYKTLIPLEFQPKEICVEHIRAPPFVFNYLYI